MVEVAVAEFRHQDARAHDVAPPQEVVAESGRGEHPIVQKQQIVEIGGSERRVVAGILVEVAFPDDAVDDFVAERLSLGSAVQFGECQR